MEGRLRELQGDLESRLDALTRAFEAYVELDQVREQLAGFPDHSRVRRLSVEAIQNFEVGTVGATVPDIPDYWLPPAVNSLQPGGFDQVAAQTALDRDAHSASLFLASLLGANGYGLQVQELVVHALRTDDGLWSDAQQLLYRAVLDGAYGAAAIGELEALVTAQLVSVAEADWHTWVRGQAGDSATAQLQWLIQLYAADQSTSMEDSDDRYQEDLRAIAAGELSEGSPGERDLLRRARELREVVGNPTHHDASSEFPTMSIVQVVQGTVVGPGGTPRQRQQVREWLRPYLLRVVQSFVTPAETPPATVEVRGGRKTVPVTARGPEPTALSAARRSVAELNTPDSVLTKRAGLLGIGLATGSILMWLLSVAVLGVLLGLVALIAFGVAAWSWWQTRGMATQAERAQQRLQEDVRRAQQRAAKQDEIAIEEARRHSDLVLQAREALTAGLTEPITSS